MGRAAGFAAVVVAAVLAPVLAAPAEATIRGAAGSIAFDSDRAGARDIFVMPVGSAGGLDPALPIAANDAAALDVEPAWTPLLDPFRLFAAHETRASDVFEVTITGATNVPQRVIVAGQAVDFSAQQQDFGLEIRADHPDGAGIGGVICLVGQSGDADVHPAWPSTAVGQLPQDEGTFGHPLACHQPLAFESDRTGDREVWLWNPALGLSAGGGTPPNPVNVTQRPDAQDGSPAWSTRAAPSAGAGQLPRSLLAFDSDRDGDRDIYVLDPLRPLADGGDSPNPVNLTSNAADDANPDWSPDGTQLTWDSDAGGERRIWVMDLVTDAEGRVTPGAARPVTIDQPDASDPSWYEFFKTALDEGDPDAVFARAHQIAFSGAGETADADIHYVEHLPGDGVPFATGPFETFSLLVGPGQDVEPAWSPRGARIVFASNVGGSFDLWTMDSDGADQQQITADPVSNDRNPAWQSRFLEADIAPRRPRGRARPRARRSSVTTTVTPPPVTVTTNGPGPQGGAKPGECTRLGTPRDDTLAGTAGPDVLCGGGGDDRLQGFGGDDTLRGGSGDDRLEGGRGNDSLAGGRGRDRLAGGRGDDQLSGDGGRDELRGGAGKDRLLARDRRRDVVDGGGGRDVARADRRLDRVASIEGRVR